MSTDHSSALDRLIDDHSQQTGKPSTGKAMGAGVRWMGPTQIVVQVVRIGSVFVLARLLEPEQFGVVALVTVITGLFERVLGDTGTTTAVVRHPQLSQGLASSVLFLNIAVGATTTAALLAFGGPIASLLGDASAADIVRVMGILAIVNSFAHVPRALFRRRLQFRNLALVNLSNAVVTAAATIALALAGWDEWSIVLGNLGGSVVATALAWALTSWRPSMHFSRTRLAEIASFSGNLTAQNIFGYISYAGDRFIVGRFLGTTELGYYGMANRLMRYPVQTTAQTYREVVFPNLARLQDDHAAMAAAYRRSVSGIALLIFPVCAAVAATAHPLVSFALGSKWEPASNVLALVAVTSGLQAVASTTGSLYNARGRSDLSLRWQIFSSISLVAAYSVGASWGLTGVAWGYLIGIAILTPAAFVIPLRLIDARPRSVLSTVAALGALAAVGGGLGYLVARWVRDQGVGDFGQVAAGTATLLVVYAGTLAVWRPQPVRDLSRLVRRNQRNNSEK